MTILKASEPYILTFLYRMMSSAKKSSWNMGLVNSMHDPALLFISTDLGVVIRDKYPKARHHFLVLPKSDIPSIYHVSLSLHKRKIIWVFIFIFSSQIPLKVKRKDLSLLYELHLLAVNVIEILGMKTDDFKIGFHALPSMQRLHLHVISTNFISSCLKTKKHWNSFNTELFLDYERESQYVCTQYIFRLTWIFRCSQRDWGKRIPSQNR